MAPHIWANRLILINNGCAEVLRAPADAQLFLYCNHFAMKKFIPLSIWLLCAWNMPLQAQGNLRASQQELIGSKLWDLSFTDWLQNRPADTSFSGKFKVLEFWATWCRPCLEAVPHLNKLQRQFADSNIVFLSVTHQSPEETAKTLQKYQFETIVVSDRSRRVHTMLRISYKGTMALPRTVILDAHNRILWYGSPRTLTEKLLRFFLRQESRN